MTSTTPPCSTSHPTPQNHIEVLLNPLPPTPHPPVFCKCEQKNRTKTHKPPGVCKDLLAYITCKEHVRDEHFLLFVLNPAALKAQYRTCAFELQRGRWLLRTRNVWRLPHVIQHLVYTQVFVHTLGGICITYRFHPSVHTTVKLCVHHESYMRSFVQH